jgi:excisionase family DNA binding protein
MQRIAVPINKAAELAGLSRSTIYRLFNQRRLTPRKAGNRTLIFVAELEEYLRSLPTGEGARPLSTEDGDEH